MFCDEIMPKDIRLVFAKYRPENWVSLDISLPEQFDDNHIVIPENFLVNHVINGSIEIKCLSSKVNKLSKIVLEIHPNAFGAQLISEFVIENCDMNATKEYSFMNGFNRLTQFWLNGSINMDLDYEWGKLLSIKNEDQRFAEQGLKIVRLLNNRMSELTVRCILQGILHLSVETLEQLDIEGNFLTAIPEEIKHFRSLTHLEISGQRVAGFKIHTIPIDLLQDPDLEYIKNWEKITLTGISLQGIEPGTFSLGIKQLY